ncbi:uncharacterized protein HDC37_001474 [Microbacterium sp. AK009]|uniref:DUF418 domain-containing protein n=1 Tax=Microbacterium sp. AK009 TaxID=2723068 RepID=UPI0015C806A8|nr:DUF418 domain-containing protein [Microbacterium sp. AK009]NYF16649.1 uncharacterized protein [Microbacterium sp. AK009]
MNVSAPQSSASRQLLPDALRGFALAGIVVVNAPFLAVSNDGLYGDLSSPLDQIAAFLVVMLAQGKFYLLFAFLFGYSAHLMMPAARDRSEDFRRQRTRFLRRLLGLFVLGAIHAVFIFIGDILMGYAVIGLALVLLISRSSRAILIAAICVCSAGLIILSALMAFASSSAPATGGFVGDASALDAALRGGFLEGAAGRLQALPDALAFQAIVNLPLALGMFLLGLVAARAGILATPERFPRLWRRLKIAAVTLGVPGGIVAGWLVVFGDGSELTATASIAIGFGTAPALAAGYLAVAASASSRVLSLAAPAGRMSLTGYLGESVVFAAIFCGWGLGLFGEVPVWAAVLIGLAVWVMIDVLSRWWLHVFRYGPLEWLLRMWSRGQPVELMRSPGSARRGNGR